MERNRRHDLFRVDYCKGISCLHLSLAETQKQGGMWENVIVKMGDSGILGKEVVGTGKLM